MRSRVSVLMLSAVAVLGLATVAHSDSGPSVGAGGIFFHPLFGKVTFSTTAVTHQDGRVTGHWNFKLHDSEGFVKSRVECLELLELLEGNLAILSGVIRKGVSPFPPFDLTGLCFVVAGLDRGEGEDSPPDLVSDAIILPCSLLPAETACRGVFIPPSTPIKGNIQAKP